MIARLAALFAAALLLAGCTAAEPARDWPDPSPALWAIGPPEAPRGWLFGTVHALPEGARWRTPALDRALAASGPLVVEIADLADASAAARAFEGASRAPNLPPLAERVPPAERPRLAALVSRSGLDPADLNARKTWAAAILLASALRREDTALGVDRALLDEAYRTEGLESFSAQYARFDALSPRAQAQLLLSVADDAASAAQDARIEAWLTGDTDRLAALTDGRLLADPELHEALLAARNRAFAGRIAALVDAGERPFVAVGAGHMLGAEGLPALLRARGYAVERVQ